MKALYTEEISKALNLAQSTAQSPSRRSIERSHSARDLTARQKSKQRQTIKLTEQHIVANKE